MGQARAAGQRELIPGHHFPGSHAAAAAVFLAALGPCFVPLGTVLWHWPCTPGGHRAVWSPWGTG